MRQLTHERALACALAALASVISCLLAAAAAAAAAFPADGWVYFVGWDCDRDYLLVGYAQTVAALAKAARKFLPLCWHNPCGRTCHIHHP